MRYYFEKPDIFRSLYGETYVCNHPVYDKCTLYKINGKGLAVVQQRFNPDDKSVRQGEIDAWLTDAIYLHPNFLEYFDSRAEVCLDGLYPTVTVWQIMWALKMKPLKREWWEVVFDRRKI